MTKDQLKKAEQVQNEIEAFLKSKGIDEFLIFCKVENRYHTAVKEQKKADGTKGKLEALQEASILALTHL